MELMQAHEQWMTRPDDERFTSLTELAAHCQFLREHSAARTVSSRSLEARPMEGSAKALALIGPGGNAVAVSNWAFGQLAQRGAAPAGYLRTLPAALAADCINYGLKFSREPEEIGVLLYQNGGAPMLRAATGPNYGRVWNATIADALVRRFGDGISGDFRVPVEFGSTGGAHPGVTKENTTIYAGDRDMFVFLADEERRIEVPNRRNGRNGSLARGFFVWNSEVGSKTYGLAHFLFDYMCGNHIVWGVEQYAEISGRHTAAAPDRWIESVAPAIERLSRESAAPVEHMLASAQAKKVENLDAFLASRFTRTEASGIKAAHMAEEQRPIESLWDVAVGVTAYARGIRFTDDRVTLERAAGKVLDLAL